MFNRVKNSSQSNTAAHFIHALYGLTQYIEMGSRVFQYDVPQKWITQRHVGPVSENCEWTGCHVLCLRHDIPVWQHICPCTIDTSRHRRDMTSDVKAILKPKQTNQTCLFLFQESVRARTTTDFYHDIF